MYAVYPWRVMGTDIPVKMLTFMGLSTSCMGFERHIKRGWLTTPPTVPGSEPVVFILMIFMLGEWPWAFGSLRGRPKPQRSNLRKDKHSRVKHQKREASHDFPRTNAHSRTLT